MKWDNFLFNNSVRVTVKQLEQQQPHLYRTTQHLVLLTGNFSSTCRSDSEGQRVPGQALQGWRAPGLARRTEHLVFCSHFVRSRFRDKTSRGRFINTIIFIFENYNAKQSPDMLDLPKRLSMRSLEARECAIFSPNQKVLGICICQ